MPFEVTDAHRRAMQIPQVVDVKVAAPGPNWKVVIRRKFLLLHRQDFAEQILKRAGSVKFH